MKFGYHDWKFRGPNGGPIPRTGPKEVELVDNPFFTPLNRMLPPSKKLTPLTQGNRFLRSYRRAMAKLK